MTSTLKKVLLSLAVVVSFVGYAFWSGLENPATADNTIASSQDLPDVSTGGTSASSESTSPSTQPTTTTPTPTTSGAYRDGTYTGKSTDAFYGMIQVQAVISGGKLTDVKFLQYPNDRGTSIQISQQSMPVLRQEAIAAQSADVDNVSGATQTADAFKQSLTSALAQANS